MPATHRPCSHRLRLGRHSEPGRIYLVTTATRDRRPVFGDWNRAAACARILHRAPRDAPVTTLAWVLMPDHLHWLIGLDDGTLATVVQRFKSRSARAVNTVAGGHGSLWQPGYHDRAVRREEDVRKLARYVIANPLRAGLCERIGDYPFWDAAWL